MLYIELLALYALLIVLTPLMGLYLAHVFAGERTFLFPILGWLERGLYKVAGIDPLVEMNWKSYGLSLLIFNTIGFSVLLLILMFQGVLPFNPEHFSHLPFPLAFNTAVSYVTNTNWQAYAGETTMSYLSDTLGLTVQNFLSAATGLAVLLVLIRGISRKETDRLGNFWADLVRSVVYVLLPLSFMLAVILVSQGVIANLSPYLEVRTLEGERQILPMGPAASQVAIKQLGTNGGGFFNANSAHPFENPTRFSNWLQIWAMLFLPMSLVFTYGECIGKRRHAWILWGVMSLLWLTGLGIAWFSESLYNPITGAFPLLEGKESRFGVQQSILWSTVTTATSNGSVNSMLSSLTPLAGGIALFNMMVNELIFGGVGVGLISMLMYVLLTVFLAGLMVGRSPEYMGKKIETNEIFWVMFSIFLPSAMVLIGSTFFLPKINQGPHALTEILYAFTSTAQNNGSSFAGFEANTTFYNFTLGFVMLLGRLAALLPALRIASLLAHKNKAPPSTGTFSTDTFLFAILLLSIILIVGALTFFPLISLGPIVEHFMMLNGRAIG